MAKTVLGRHLSNYGALPKDPAPEQDTEPNLFGGQSGDDPTVPRCFFCGRSGFDADDAFERGIIYALNQTQSLLKSRGLTDDEAKSVMDYVRSVMFPEQYVLKNKV